MEFQGEATSVRLSLKGVRHGMKPSCFKTFMQKSGSLDVNNKGYRLAIVDMLLKDQGEGGSTFLCQLGFRYLR